MRKKLQRIFTAIICVLLFYSWLGFFFIPATALSLINQKLHEYSNEPAQLQRLQLNPFTLKVELWQLHIGQTQEPTLAFEHFSTRLAWSSLWQGKLHVEDVQLTRPQTALQINQLGELNLLQLFNLPPATEEPEEQQPDTNSPLIIQVDRIGINAGSLSFSDLSTTEPIAVSFNELDLQLENLNTAPDAQGQLQLRVHAADGTQLIWQGVLSLEPLASSGKLQIDNIALASWWPYVAERTRLQLDSGSLSLATDYQLQAQPQWQLQTRDASLQLDQLDLSSQQQPLLAIEQLSITQVSFDLLAQSLRIGLIESNNLHSQVHIDRQGTLNWLAAVSPPEKPATTVQPDIEQQEQSSPAAPAAEPVTTAEQTTADSNSITGLANLPWQIRLDRLALNNYALNFQDNSQADPIAIALQQLNVRLTSFDSRSEEPAQLDLDTQVGSAGRLELQAKINPQSLQSQLQLNSENIDLQPAQAWISPIAKVKLRSALLSSQLNAQIESLTPLNANVAGNIDVHQLHIQESAGGRDLLKWENLRLDSIKLQQTQDSNLQIGSIQLQQPYVNLVIDQQLKTNIGGLLIEQPASEKTTTEPASAFNFSLGEILIEQGSAHFADQSLTPPFATAIEQLNGRIGALESQKNQATKIDISGAVDRYAPVAIKGSLTPFDPLHNLDLSVNFKQVELTTLTPYSSKFAGYRIQRGRLNLNLNYQIEQGNLQAENSVLLEQLQFGEAVDSPDAIKLPLRMAVALLKDTQGNIDIKLPVQGNLNDPQFSVMPIVWQTLRNLITRAVSSPFRMLGNLTNSDQDLGSVNFAAGISELDATSQKSLLTLSAALAQRPFLKVNIQGTSAAQLDGIPLAEQHLQLRIRQLRYAELQERGRKIEQPMEELEISQRQFNRLMEQLYNELPQSSRLVAEPTGNRSERVEQMRQQWLAHYFRDTSLLRLLAQERSKNIRQFLVESGKVESRRLFLIDVDEQANHQKNSIASLLELDAL